MARDILKLILRHLWLALVAAITLLLRSLFLGKILTILAAIALIVGIVAAMKGKTWGLVVVLGVAVAVVAVAFLGIAPAWFAVAGAVAAVPALAALPAMFRFDAAAAAVLIALAATLGLASAYATHEGVPSEIADSIECALGG